MARAAGCIIFALGSWVMKTGASNRAGMQVGMIQSCKTAQQSKGGKTGKGRGAAHSGQRTKAGPQGAHLLGGLSRPGSHCCCSSSSSSMGAGAVQQCSHSSHQRFERGVRTWRCAVHHTCGMGVAVVGQSVSDPSVLKAWLCHPAAWPIRCLPATASPPISAHSRQHPPTNTSSSTHLPVSWSAEQRWPASVRAARQQSGPCWAHRPPLPAA